jgi:hypothetical protein
MSWFNFARTSGMATRACTLASQFCCLAASVSCWPVQIAVGLQPLLRFHQFHRVGAGSQHLAEQRIGIERDGRYQIIQLLRRESLPLGLACAGGGAGACANAPCPFRPSAKHNLSIKPAESESRQVAFHLPPPPCYTL